MNKSQVTEMLADVIASNCTKTVQYIGICPRNNTQIDIILQPHLSEGPLSIQIKELV